MHVHPFEMIPERSFPIVRELWPVIENASRRNGGEAKLLLALAWVRSGLVPTATSPDGGVGLLLMTPLAAEHAARRLGLKKWDLTDPATALVLGSCELRLHMEHLGMPRLAVAAFLVGAQAVQAAGGQVPRIPELQRNVRDVLVVWNWIVRNLPDVLSKNGADAAPPPRTVSDDANECVTIPTTQTATTCTACTSELAQAPWRVLTPNQGTALWISDDVLGTLETVAAELGLAFSRDEEDRRLYLALPVTPPLKSHGRLIVPVPGANASSNGAYVGARGLDVIVPLGSPVAAVAAGTIVQTGDGTVLLQLDRPYVQRGRAHPYVRYHYLSRVRFGEPGRHLEQGETLGWSGVAGRVPLVRVAVSQDAEGEQFVEAHNLAAYFGWIGG